MFITIKKNKFLQQVAEHLEEKTMAFAPDCFPTDNYPHVCIHTGFVQLNVYAFFCNSAYTRGPSQCNQEVSDSFKTSTLEE